MKLPAPAAYIYSLIEQGEHVQQDFKQEISDSRKIARSLSAFSNTLGGRLLIGVKDNGRIAGVRSDEEVYMVQAAAQLYCSPAVDVAIEAYNVEGKTVLVATIPPAPAKPVMARDENNRLWAYVRIADENILATAVHMGVWRCATDRVPTALHFTEREEQLLHRLAGDEYFTVNRLARALSMPRPQVVSLLARFVHWGVVEMARQDGGFVYRAAR